MNQGYRWPLLGLHWLTLALIVGAFVIGIQLEDLPLSPFKLKLFSWHKWLGMTVLFLLPIRLLARATDGLDHSAGLLPWEARASMLVHAALYLLMLIVPFLGWLASSASGFQVVWFGVLPLPDLIGKNKVLAESLGEIHAGFVYTLVALVTLHAAAAIYHHRIRHDDVLVRMLPWLRKHA
jgi:cytochrome b561